MRYVKFWVSTGYAGAAREEVIEVPDNATDKEIQEEFNAWLDELDSSWWECDENGDEL